MEREPGSYIETTNGIQPNMEDEATAARLSVSASAPTQSTTIHTEEGIDHDDE